MQRRINKKKGIEERRWKEKKKQIDFLIIGHEEYSHTGKKKTKYP